MNRPKLHAAARLFALTVLFAGLAALPARAQDPLKAAPDMYRLLFENDRVRVMEVTFEKGEKIAPHSHPDHTIYVLDAGKLDIHVGDKVTHADVAAGQVMFVPAETHWAVNVGDTKLRLLVTELKEPAKAAPAAK